MTETATTNIDHPGTVVEPDRLVRFTIAVFEQVGFSSADADQTADYFLWVELHDLPFVGARRIPELVERVRAGGSRIGSTVELIRDRPGFAVADAGDTLAQLSGVGAMQLAIEKARVNGVGLVVLRNVTTAGALGYYADVAADSGHDEALRPGLDVDPRPAPPSEHRRRPVRWCGYCVEAPRADAAADGLRVRARRPDRHVSLRLGRAFGDGAPRGLNRHQTAISRCDPSCARVKRADRRGGAPSAAHPRC